MCCRSERADEVAEWLRRWTANPLGSARVGSNPILVVIFFYFFAAFCQIEAQQICNRGFWGPMCANQCHCLHAQDCHPTTGECSGQCAIGYTDIPRCQTRK